MLTLVKQELFKLSKKKSTWLEMIFLLIVQTSFALRVKNNPDLGLTFSFKQGYYGFELIVFFLIAAAATIITSEFEYGTIKNLLYQKYNRGQILASKWLTILCYSIYWYILATIISVGLKVVLFPKVSLFEQIGFGGLNRLSYFLELHGAQLLTTLLLVSLVLLVANLFTNSAVAVSIGIVGYFSTILASAFIGSFISKWEGFKWNPFTMLNYPALISNGVSHLDKLSAPQMFTGNVVFIGIFLLLGSIVFSKRNV